jgi:hypothetical protein
VEVNLHPQYAFTACNGTALPFTGSGDSKRNETYSSLRHFVLNIIGVYRK